ncbi:hypothetical protein [Oceanicaulis sp.]|uniref:hypothetical protein n=1 Tax=Oceanicaulis sp. TaxID=1924941 RepID=UPI003BAD27EF
MSDSNDYDFENNPYVQHLRKIEEQRRIGLEHIDPVDAYNVADAPPKDVHESYTADWEMLMRENWRDYAQGNKAAIVVCLLMCARYGKPIPAPIADEFDRLMELLISGKSKTWEDVFGPAREPSKRKTDIRSERRLKWDFYYASQALRFGCTAQEYARWEGSHERFFENAPPPETDLAKSVDDEFFELLGEEFHMSAGRARKLYYQLLDYHRFGGRVHGPRFPNGLDQCFGL